MNKRSQAKQCNYCKQKVFKLTHEHIPPRCIGNNKRIRIYESQFLLDIITNNNDINNSKEIDYKPRYYRNGHTKKTLCSKCNSTSGVKHVNDFKEIYEFILITAQNFIKLQDYVFEDEILKSDIHIPVDFKLIDNYKVKLINFMKLIMFQMIAIQELNNKGTTHVDDFIKFIEKELYLSNIVIEIILNLPSLASNAVMALYQGNGSIVTRVLLNYYCLWSQATIYKNNDEITFPRNDFYNFVNNIDEYDGVYKFMFPKFESIEKIRSTELVGW